MTVRSRRRQPVQGFTDVLPPVRPRGAVVGHSTEGSDSGPASGGLPVDLVRIRGAMAAGLSPADALATARDPQLSGIAGRVRLGSSVCALVDAPEVTDRGVQLLLRALAVAERAGSGAGLGVAQALAAIRETRGTDRMLAAKTAQARGTATLMAGVPVVAWIALIGLDMRTLRFYTTPVGVVTGVLALVSMLAGRWWSRRLVTRAADAPAGTDPLQPRRPRPDIRRAAVVGVGVAVPVAVLAGPFIGVVTGVGTAIAAARPPRVARVDLGDGGTPEAAELLALALGAGLSLPAACLLVGEVGPTAARAALEAAGRRLHSGWSPAAAFGRTPLTVLGELLDAAERYGAPAAPSLREYAEELRAERRVAAEEAAERTQLALVFPTTLLTLPGFALAVVPPLVWAGFAA